MPNHITNLLVIKGDENRVEELLSFVKGKEEQFDFGKIIPMPESLHIVSGSNVDNAMAIIRDDESYFSKMLDYAWVKEEKIKTISQLKKRVLKNLSPDDLEQGRIALDNLKKYGHKDWYTWSIANWGTKWNAYSVEYDLREKNKISFETAWSTPFPVMNKLAQIFNDLRIEVYFADEDLGSNCGLYVFENGILAMEYLPKDWEAYKFACTLKGIEDDEQIMENMSWYVLRGSGIDKVLNEDLENYLSCEFERENLIKTLFYNCQSENDVEVVKAHLNHIALNNEIYEAMNLINEYSNEMIESFKN